MIMSIDEVYENLCTKDVRSPDFYLHDEDEVVVARRDVNGWYYTHTSGVDSSLKDVYITPNTEFYYKDERYIAPMFAAHDDYVSLSIENIDERNIWLELLQR